MGFFSSHKSDKHRAIEAQNNEKERRKDILKWLNENVSLAVRMAAKRSERNEPARAEVIKVPYWKESSVMRVRDYIKLDDEKSAIESDVAYFREAVQGLRDQYPEWDIKVRYPSSGEKEPDTILVQKK
jgi:hypothetical protein